MAKTRYFLAANPNQLIEGVAFDSIGSVGGTLYGVYETDDASQSKKLASSKLVEELTLEQYLYHSKKKRTQQQFKPLNVPSEPQVAIKQPPKAAVESQESKPSRPTSAEVISKALQSIPEPPETPDPEDQ